MKIRKCDECGLETTTEVSFEYEILNKGNHYAGYCSSECFFKGLDRFYKLFPKGEVSK